MLRLDGNSITGQLPELPSTVQEIRVQNNELHGTIPRGYGFLKQLHTFKAEENKLSGSIPSGLPLPLRVPCNVMRHLSIWCGKTQQADSSLLSCTLHCRSPSLSSICMLILHNQLIVARRLRGHCMQVWRACKRCRSWT